MVHRLDWGWKEIADCTALIIARESNLVFCFVHRTSLLVHVHFVKEYYLISSDFRQVIRENLVWYPIRILLCEFF